MIKEAVKFSKEEIMILKDIAKRNKLKGADVLDGFSEDQIAESFNGAGSSAEPEWKRWVLTKILHKKLPAIMIHDMAYRKGGTDKDFKRVNEELKDNILTLDHGSDSSWWRFVADKAKEYSDKRGKPGWGKV